MDKELSKYAHCMEEIKLRKSAIDAIYCKKNTTLYPITNLEFMALQLRKILELIAFSSLVANVDEYKKIRISYATDWNANRILKQIESINPKFFPSPIIRKTNEQGITEWVTKDNPFTKNEFEQAFSFVSDLIHTENPFTHQPHKIQDDIDKMVYYMSRIVDLLSEHIITLSGIDKIINCLMVSIEDGKTHVTVFEKT